MMRASATQEQLVQSPANGIPAADTEVLLPYAQDSDQASTAAPPDDERDMFGREEALRMDEEIMDFQWFEHVTWDSIKDSRGMTYVQPPTSNCAHFLDARLELFWAEDWSARWAMVRAEVRFA